VNLVLPSTPYDLAAAYLDLVDAEAPGLVVGLYLTGSVALGEFRPPRSDVDFVAVLSAPADATALAALGRVHAAVNARWQRPPFEGIYLTWQDLARDPAACGPVPYAHDRAFVPAGRFELSPVTWATLARHGVRIRGPGSGIVGIWDDPAALDRWTRENLDAYWRPWLARAGRLASRGGLASLGPWATEWGVLGVSRLHYTLTSGEITSKYGAGLYAMRRFPLRWHRIVVEALRIRRGDRGRSGYATPLGRRREMLAYVALVIDDALALPPR
jgi:hypothetical protein